MSSNKKNVIDDGSLPKITPELLDSLSQKPLKVLEVFSGEVYQNQDIGDDNPHRFESVNTILMDVVITVEDNTVLFGDKRKQKLEIAASKTLGFTKLDLSTLYFKNKTGGLNGKTTILGTLRD